MRARDYFSMVSRNLYVRKDRVALTANGVLIGTAAAVLLVSLGIGMRSGVMAQFESIDDLRSIQVSPVTSSSSASPDQGQVVRPLDGDALETMRSFSSVISVIPQTVPIGYVECTFGKWTSTSNIIGLDVQDLAELGRTAQSGTTRQKRGTVILGQGTLDSFGELIEYASGGSIQYVGLEAGDLLGEKLRFVIHKNSGEQTKIVDMRVAGVLAGDSSDRNIYLRAEDVATWNAFAISRPNHVSRDSFSQVIVEANSITQVDALAGQIEMLGFDTITSSLVERVKQTYSLISILLGITGLISLVMAGVGVANTMIAATLEQTNEIGLWKALGASNRTIMGLILGQAVGIGLLGGLGGALTGWLGAWLYNLLGGMTLTVEVYNQPGTQVLFAQTPPWLLLAAPTFAMLVGLVSGLSPAMHAAAMPPIKALKEE